MRISVVRFEHCAILNLYSSSGDAVLFRRRVGVSKAKDQSLLGQCWPKTNHNFQCNVGSFQRQTPPMPFPRKSLRVDCHNQFYSVCLAMSWRLIWKKQNASYSLVLAWNRFWQLGTQQDKKRDVCLFVMFVLPQIVLKDWNLLDISFDIHI